MGNKATEEMGNIERNRGMLQDGGEFKKASLGFGKGNGAAISGTKFEGRASKKGSPWKDE